MAKNKKYGDLGQRFGDLSSRSDEEKQAIREELSARAGELRIEIEEMLKKGKAEAIGDSEKPKTQRTTKAGELRYTVLIDQGQLEQVKHISAETGLPIKKLFSAALEQYLETTWTDEKLAEFKKMFGKS